MHQKKLQRKYLKISNNKYMPIQAYIMTCMYPGMYNKVLDEMKKIKNIEKISIVTGDYDIIVKVNVKNLEQLHKLTSQIHKVNGVEKTNTQIIEKECKLFNVIKT
jgi:DNA-binding Lrp family transcriptional regulator